MNGGDCQRVLAGSQGIPVCDLHDDTSPETDLLLLPLLLLLPANTSRRAGVHGAQSLAVSLPACAAHARRKGARAVPSALCQGPAASIAVSWGLEDCQARTAQKTSRSLVLIPWVLRPNISSDLWQSERPSICPHKFGTGFLLCPRTPGVCRTCWERRGKSSVPFCPSPGPAQLSWQQMGLWSRGCSGPQALLGAAVAGDWGGDQRTGPHQHGSAGSHACR